MSDAPLRLKSSSGMVVQVIRNADKISNTTSGEDYAIPSGFSLSSVLNHQSTPSGKRIILQPQGRALSVTPAIQSRFTATNRLGVPSSAPSMTYGLKRPLLSDYTYECSAIRKFPRCNDKSKGLRHFSTKVCEKVKEKGQTNYNEVSDELVQEYFDSLSNPPCDQEKQQYDMKNIRRRVYDALNVLMAMNIIEKEKKEIRWVGLPTSSLQECRRLEEEKLKRQDRIKHKAEQLQELVIQLVAYKSLVERNREQERNGGRPVHSAVLYLPYIVINTDKRTVVDCAISHDKTEYLFAFDQPFEIHDDIEVLKRLGLAHGLEKASVDRDMRPKIKSYLPPTLREYVDHILEGTLCGGLIGPSVKPIQTTPIDRKPLPLGQTDFRGTSEPSAIRTFNRPIHEYGSRMALNPHGAALRYTVVPRNVSQIGQRYGMAYRTAGHRGSPFPPLNRGYSIQTPQQRFFQKNLNQEDDDDEEEEEDEEDHGLAAMQ